MRILLIDDDALVAKTMARLLRAHDVQIMGCAEDALEPIFSNSYDLIFCDLMLPGISGPELFAMVQARDAALADRFVFVTGGAYTPESSAFLADDKRKVLHKPFDRRDLQAILDAVSARSGSAQRG